MRVTLRRKGLVPQRGTQAKRLILARIFHELTGLVLIQKENPALIAGSTIKGGGDKHAILRKQQGI